jgi:hypothetical protein
VGCIATVSPVGRWGSRSPVVPPYRAGSIAARGRRSSKRRVLAVIPALIGGLHCGEEQLVWDALAICPVIPPFTGGLHCGSAYRLVASWNGLVSSSSWAGSVAARCPSRPAQRGGSPPAKSRAAQLRRSRQRLWTLLGRVIPLLSSGLHCDGTPLIVAPGYETIIPLSGAGSIAAGTP